LTEGAWERHFPDRPDISNMGPLEQYDAFLILVTEDVTCEMPVADPPGTERTLTIPAGSWANFGWTGASSPQEVADCFDEGRIAVMYRLDADTQQFERWFRGREELSTMGDVAQFDALLALNASDQPAACTMNGG
jgi:hypothetical protein